MANTARMTALQRREQLIRVGRALFASKGFEAVSVEEIAANAKVSKPIVYEHFGGKGSGDRYAVIVDREMRELTHRSSSRRCPDTKAHPLPDRGARAYSPCSPHIEENSEGFRARARLPPTTDLYADRSTRCWATSACAWRICSPPRLKRRKFLRQGRAATMRRCWSAPLGRTRWSILGGLTEVVNKEQLKPHTSSTSHGTA
ncbi:MAG: TetR/AcrR family transcriptional regulator [Bifidobacterium bifidum]